MLWHVAAPFFQNNPVSGAPIEKQWIDDFCETDLHKFRKIDSAPRSPYSWHNRRSRASTFPHWAAYWEQAGRALRGADGVITVFPQLAVAASARQSFRLRAVPHVAWCFNIGRLPGGLGRAAARKLLGHVSQFIVHSTGECRVISEYLNVPLTSVCYFPLQRNDIPVYHDEDKSAPFIVSMGSANRDYATLLQALSLVKVPTVIVAAPRALKNLELPPHVRHVYGLTPEECVKLVQRARFSVVALEQTTTAAGQVTVVESLMTGRAVVATRHIGTVDYIADGYSGLLVPPGDPVALSRALQLLWEDPELARRYGANGAAYAKRELSDRVAGRNLLQVLNDVAIGSKLALGARR